MMRHVLLAFCVLFLGNTYAGTYRWVDEKGTVHYSDQAPPFDAKEVTTVRSHRAATPVSPSAATAPAKQKSYAEMEAEFKKRRVETAEAETKKQKDLAEVAEKRKNCEAAQGRVKLYERGGRITRTGPDGEPYFLDENGISEGLAEAKKSADSWCKS